MTSKLPIFLKILNSISCYVCSVDDELVGGQENLANNTSGRQPNSLSFDEKVALLGKPKLGEITRSQIRIKESKEFKVKILLLLLLLG